MQNTQALVNKLLLSLKKNRTKTTISNEEVVIIRRQEAPWLFDVFFGEGWDTHALISVNANRTFKVLSGTISVSSSLAKSLYQAIEERWFYRKNTQPHVSENKITPH